MTLFRQLLTAIVVIFVLIGTGIEAIYLSNARTYLQEQMESHSQDTATALGLSLATAMAANDPVLAETIVGATFDRGFYREIRVVDARGQTLVVRQLPAAPPEVPAWFAKILQLEAPPTESLIATGWRNAGRVAVTSLPNFAYRQLWDTAQYSLAWLAVLFGGSIVLSAVYLNSILRPLQEIEQAAQTIGERNFVTIRRRPRARELQHAIDTINHLSAKVKEMLGHEIARAMEWRALALADPVTGLDNRRGFEQQAANMLAADGAAKGTLFIVELNDFKSFNDREGFQRGDELLAAIGAVLAGLCQPAWLLARLGGSTFSLLALSLDRDDLTGLGDQLCRALANALADRACSISFQCGGAGFDAVTTLPALLATADLAIEQSRQMGANNFKWLDGTTGAADGHGSGYWKQLIQQAIAQSRVRLFAQPVVAIDGDRELQLEIMGRIDNGDDLPIPAEQFMPMASRHQLMGMFDLCVIDCCVTWLQSAASTAGRVAINLSLQTISDGAVRGRIMDVLDTWPALARRMVFEVSEMALANDIESAETFALAVRRRGADIAVDNFGLHRSAFDYLLRVKPAYIKLSWSLTANVAHDASQRMFVNTVVGIAQPLGIAVYAVRVEQAELVAALGKQGVAGYQGHLSRAPEPVAF